MVTEQINSLFQLTLKISKVLWSRKVAILFYILVLKLFKYLVMFKPFNCRRYRKQYSEHSRQCCRGTHIPTRCHLCFLMPYKVAADVKSNILSFISVRKTVRVEIPTYTLLHERQQIYCNLLKTVCIGNSTPEYSANEVKSPLTLKSLKIILTILISQGYNGKNARVVKIFTFRIVCISAWQQCERSYCVPFHILFKYIAKNCLCCH